MYSFIVSAFPRSASAAVLLPTAYPTAMPSRIATISRATTIRIIGASWIISWLTGIVHAPDGAKYVADLAERCACPDRVENRLHQGLRRCARGRLDPGERLLHFVRVPLVSDLREAPLLRLGQLGVVGRTCRRRGISRDVFVHAQDRKSTRLNSSHANISYAV